MRTVVLMRQDVAPSNWDREWSALVADAEGGQDGFALAEQRIQAEFPVFRWSVKIGVDKDGRDTFETRWIAPPGWAAFYLSKDHRPPRAALHFQNY